MSKLSKHGVLTTSPGDIIAEQLEYVGMSQAELAERMGRSIPKINELIKGKAPLTEDTALKLESVTGLSSHTLLNIERTYRDSLLEYKKNEILSSYVDWSKKFPAKLLKNIGLVKSNLTQIQLAEELLKFFGVASPSEWEHILSLIHI